MRQYVGYFLRDFTLPKKNFPDTAQKKVIENIMAESVG